MNHNILPLRTGVGIAILNSQNKVFNKILFFILGALIINLFIIYFSKKNSILSNLIFVAAIFLILHSFLDIKKLINKKSSRVLQTQYKKEIGP